MQDHQTQSSSDEIDLVAVFDKIKSIFKSILIGIVQVFQFFWKHKFRLLILFIIGVGLQVLLTSQVSKIYKNELLVRTNFGSTEYLYSKVKSINSKLKSEDTLYLNEIFGKNYNRVAEVEVVPVVDVYNLVNKSEENREVFELLLEEYGDISFLEEEINVNEYPTHKLNIYIKGKEDNENIANKLYEKLANNAFYNEMKVSTLENLQEQLDENKRIRSQIDSIIRDQKGIPGFTTPDNNSINFSGSQNLQALLNQKKELLENDLEIKEQLSSEDEVLKIVDSSFGVYDKDKTSSYLFIPIAFLSFYCLIFLFSYLTRSIISFIER